MQENAVKSGNTNTSALLKKSQSAESKRCRFAVKDNSSAAAAAAASVSGAQANQPSFHTSTSSNASTVIEQPQSKLRRSRSPSNRKLHTDHQNGVSGSTGNGLVDANKGGIEFKAPLMIEQAEELMLMAKMGKVTYKPSCL